MKNWKVTLLAGLVAASLLTPPAQAEVDLPGLLQMVGGQTTSSDGLFSGGGLDSSLGLQLGGMLLQRLLAGDGAGEIPQETVQVVPAPDSTIAFARPTVQVSFAQPIQSEGVRLVVDGREVTSEATVDKRFVRWVPSADLAPGRHQAYLEVLGRDNLIQSQSWEFQVR